MGRKTNGFAGLFSAVKVGLGVGFACRSARWGGGVSGWITGRRSAREALQRARLVAEEVHRHLEAVQDALLRIQSDVSTSGAAAEIGTALWPPPAGHQLKEEAEALRLCTQILSARLEDADDLALAG